MTYVDLSAGLACLPGVGPFFSSMNLVSDREKRAAVCDDFSRVVLFQLTGVFQHTSLDVELISNALQSKAITILERGRVHSVCGIIGNTTTAVASIAFIGGLPSIVIFGSSAFLTLAQTDHFSQNTRALNILRSRL